MESMKAVSARSYGSRDVLDLEDAPCPEIGPEDVLIRIAATSVNPFDWAVRNGYLTDYYTYSFPLILGLDVSGVVEVVGSEVSSLQPGDAVYGRANPSTNGAYAEYISVPAAQVALKPQSLDFLQAAALPHVAISAWRSLLEAAGLSAGQSVLIHGAAGGVGSVAVQLAKYEGARVIATASANNLDYLRSLGADETIDYNAVRFEDVVHGVDVVLDLVGDMGDNTQQRSWQVLKPGGILVSLVQFPSPETAAAHGVRSAFVTAEVCDTQTLTEIGRMVDAGHIQPLASSVYTLADIRQAHAESESRHVRGKIVLQVADM